MECYKCGATNPEGEERKHKEKIYVRIVTLTFFMLRSLFAIPGKNIYQPGQRQRMKQMFSDRKIVEILKCYCKLPIV